MSYKLSFIQSPNFTPGSQTLSIYGRPRSIDFGAGHWWDDPLRWPSLAGVINTFLNAARQASAHAVVDAGEVIEMVRQWDTAWATNNANPYTYAIEVNPQIIYMWREGGDKELARRIFETLCEYIADKGFHNLQWFPHNHWWSTGCNPIDWNAVMARARQIVADRQAPAPDPQWKKNMKKINNITMYAIDDTTPLRNLANTPQVIKNFSKGTSFEIAAQTQVGDYIYYLTKYAYENNTGQGFDTYELQATDPNAPPLVPEWQRNIVDIDDIKLMVLPAEGTQVVHLATGANITPLAKGTWVDIAKKTTVNGKVYLISKYSIDNALPNGILMSDLGIPVEPPKQEKPEWLQNWEDIEDVTMYTRVKTPLVNLIDGSTIKEIEINIPVEIASATTWHGQRYLITKYATSKGDASGIPLANLDKDPIKQPEVPAQPDPQKPVEDLIRENNSILKQLLALVQWIVDKLKGVK